MKAVSPFSEAEDEIDDALAVSRDAAALRAAIDTAIQDIATGLKTYARIARSPYRRYPAETVPVFDRLHRDGRRNPDRRVPAPQATNELLEEPAPEDLIHDEPTA